MAADVTRVLDAVCVIPGAVAGDVTAGRHHALDHPGQHPRPLGALQVRECSCAIEELFIALIPQVSY